MKYKVPEFKSLKEMAYIDICRLTENQARDILEQIRWQNGIECPHCHSKNITRINGQAERVRDGLLQCRDCRKQFTVTTETVMHGSHITLRQWLQAFYSICSHKKGVSALQLQRNLGLHTYKSAWYLAHRIRLAMQKDPIASKLNGVVEVDETYIGGKPRYHKDNKRGRGTKKTPVVALIERNGKSISYPIENVSGKTLKSAIKELVNNASTIITDEWKSYRGIGKDFAGGHRFVNHNVGEYVVDDIYTNTAESFFALLKRGVMGVFHHISKKHLFRYCAEFSFRWDNRNVNDGERAENALMGIFGKRLAYRDCEE